MDLHQAGDRKDQTFDSFGSELIPEGHPGAIPMFVPLTVVDLQAEMIGLAEKAADGMVEDTVPDQPSGHWRLDLRAFRHAGIRALYCTNEINLGRTELYTKMRGGRGGSACRVAPYESDMMMTID